MSIGNSEAFEKWGFGKQPVPWLKGETRPFFIYDLATLEKNVLALKQAWQSVSKVRSHLFYSLKTNPNPYLISRIQEHVDGFDVSSLTELEMLKSLGISGKRITLSGPGKTDACLESALHMAVRTIHLDSKEEYEFIRKKIMNRSSKKKVSQFTLRISVAGSLVKKLGVPEEDLYFLLSAPSGLELHGFHAYLGRESFSDIKMTSVLNTMQNLYHQYRKVFSIDFQVYLGAGISAPSGDEMNPFLSIYRKSKDRLPFSVHLESGRAIISNAGCYGAPVLSVKEISSGRKLVVLDGGLQHLGSPLISPMQGQKGIACLIFQDGVLTPPTGGVTASIYGSLCYWHDILHPGIPIPSQLKRGDWMLFPSCGAYGFTAAVSQFIGQTIPREFLVDSSHPETFVQPQDISPTFFQPYHFAFPETAQNSKKEG